MAAAGRQTAQLWEGKLGPNEARRLSPASGKDKLNLGIAQSRSARRVEPSLAPLRPQTEAGAACAGMTALRCASSRWGRLHKDHSADNGLVLCSRPLRCRCELSCIADGRRRGLVAGLVAIDANVGKLRCASISLSAI